MRLFLVWELGGGLGHIARLRTLSCQLLAHGHELVLAAREPRQAKRYFPEAVSIIPVPVHVAKPKRGLARNYADILQLRGFDQAAHLQALVHTWFGLFSRVKPHGVIADFSPSVEIAAQLAALPVVSVGTGFSLPPLQTPFPSLQPWAKLSETTLQQAEQSPLQSVQTLFRQHQGVIPESLAAAFQGVRRILTTLPELDHYGPRRNCAYYGFAEPSFGDKSPSVEGAKPLVLVYLADSHPLRAAVENWLHQQSIQAVMVGTQPYQLQTLLPSVDWVLCAGGHGLVLQSLLQAKPLFLLPQQLEQFVLAWRLHKRGLIRYALPDQAWPSLEKQLLEFIQASVYTQRAEQFAAHYAAMNLGNRTADIVAKIERHLR